MLSFTWRNAVIIGPIHVSQTNRDQPNFKKIYSSPECLERTIELDNWKNSPKIWMERFNKNGTRKY